MVIITLNFSILLLNKHYNKEYELNNKTIAKVKSKENQPSS